MITVIATMTVQLLLFLFTIRFPPIWSEKIPVKWRKLNCYILLLSEIFSLLLGVFSTHYSNTFVDAVTFSSIAMVLFVLLQSFVTDVKLRLVDRRLMTFASILCFALNVSVLIFYHISSTLNFYIVFTIACSIFIFIPSIMGASDGRALVLSTVSCYCLLGMDGYFNSFKLMFALMLFVGVILNIVNNRGKTVSLFTRFFGKASIPAVPIILLAFFSMAVFHVLL